MKAQRNGKFNLCNSVSSPYRRDYFLQRLISFYRGNIGYSYAETYASFYHTRPTLRPPVEDEKTTKNPGRRTSIKTSRLLVHVRT